MSILTVYTENGKRQIEFSGEPLLSELLSRSGLYVAHPCGGRGTCLKCRVEVEGDLSEMTKAENKAVGRLSCQTRLKGDAVVKLSQGSAFQIEGENEINIASRDAVTLAVDIGTTTLAAGAYQNGKCIGASTLLNPQTAVAADVMGRIGHALNGGAEELKTMIEKGIAELLSHIDLPVEPEKRIVTGNTTMLSLLTGTDTLPLSRAPFEAKRLFDEVIKVNGHDWYFPPCMSAFVGADITCSVLASGMCRKNETALLCDIGTNGEIALWKNGTLYVTSTAAGPAFEGAGISCGCGSIPGAIDRVDIIDGTVSAHTLGERPAVGVCGSGLMDAIAAFLDLEIIDETGAADDEMELRDGICLQPRDVRAVQLAKSAIASGMETLLNSAGTARQEVRTLYIAGGFGSHLRLESARRIGLIPEGMTENVKILGNASLHGAAMMEFGEAREEGKRIASLSRHINLGGNPMFNNLYMENMLFE